MILWGTESEYFRQGVSRDSAGCGAAWARIAIAARITYPLDAIECARRALASNPEAWRPWYEAFVAHAPYRLEDERRFAGESRGQETPDERER